MPRADDLTFTRADTPWVDQSWAFDAGLAWVVDHWGWAGAVGLSALIVAWVYSSLARGLADGGATPLVSAVVAWGQDRATTAAGATPKERAKSVVRFMGGLSGKRGGTMCVGL